MSDVTDAMIIDKRCSSCLTPYAAEDGDYHPDCPAMTGKRPVGRPPKGGENLHCQVAPDVKQKIDQLADVLSCSQGDVVHQAVKALIASFKR